MALLDHAYQMGFGPKGGFTNYWRNIRKSINRTKLQNIEHFYFARAGAHLLYNFTSDDKTF